MKRKLEETSSQIQELKSLLAEYTKFPILLDINVLIQKFKDIDACEEDSKKEYINCMIDFLNLAYTNWSYNIDFNAVINKTFFTIQDEKHFVNESIKLITDLREKAITQINQGPGAENDDSRRTFATQIRFISSICKACMEKYPNNEDLIQWAYDTSNILVNYYNTADKVNFHNAVTRSPADPFDTKYNEDKAKLAPLFSLATDLVNLYRSRRPDLALQLSFILLEDSYEKTLKITEYAKSLRKKERTSNTLKIYENNILALREIWQFTTTKKEIRGYGNGKLGDKTKEIQEIFHKISMPEYLVYQSYLSSHGSIKDEKDFFNLCKEFHYAEFDSPYAKFLKYPYKLHDEPYILLKEGLFKDFWAKTEIIAIWNQIETLKRESEKRMGMHYTLALRNSNVRKLEWRFSTGAAPKATQEFREVILPNLPKLYYLKLEFSQGSADHIVSLLKNVITSFPNICEIDLRISNAKVYDNIYKKYLYTNDSKNSLEKWITQFPITFHFKNVRLFQGDGAWKHTMLEEIKAYEYFESAKAFFADGKPVSKLSKTLNYRFYRQLSYKIWEFDHYAPKACHMSAWLKSGQFNYTVFAIAMLGLASNVYLPKEVAEKIAAFVDFELNFVAIGAWVHVLKTNREAQLSLKNGNYDLGTL